MQKIDVVFPHLEDDGADILATFVFDGQTVTIEKDTNGYAQELWDNGVTFDGKFYSKENPEEFFNGLPVFISGRRIYATEPYIL